MRRPPRREVTHVQVVVPAYEARRWLAEAKRRDLRLAQLIRQAVREKLGITADPPLAAADHRSRDAR